MNSFNMLTKRNVKLFFKDKGLFFCSLITPLILLVLYITFLGKVFKDSYMMNIPAELNVSESILNGLAGGQLLSSLLAVCCVTVAFSANMLMVQDKFTGARKDLLITPLKRSKLALSYYASTFICTFLICAIATFACFIYLGVVGWYLSFADCLFILLDVFILTLFGTALSSLVNHFLSTQGQVSAVGTIVSSMYGFICGAYMPIASFGTGLQKVLMFLPGTYGSSLIRNHTMRGALEALGDSGVSAETIESIKTGIDCNLSFFGHNVSIGMMYLVIIASITLFVGAFILINVIQERKRQKRLKPRAVK